MMPKGCYVRKPWSESRHERSKIRWSNPEEHKKASETAKLYNTTFKKGHIEPNKGKTIEEIYGKERAKEIYYKISIAPREKRAEIMRKKWQDPTFREKVAKGQLDWWNTSEGKIQRESNSEWLKNMRAKNKDVYQTEEYKSKIGAKSIKNWQNRDYAMSVIKSISKEPNKKEIQLSYILRHVAPHEFRYNGDARLGVILSGKTPDFVNINGKKQVIELFGDYWHGERRTGRDKETEENRLIKLYETVGFHCLIIWEKELKNKKELEKRIKDFVYGY
jgi:G:T-mismatch repair DNA endonuclease (very short patch repair protein)